MIDRFEKYLKKHPNSIKLINSAPQKKLNKIITIPIYNEPNILSTLNSLIANQPTKFPTEVILLINNSESTTQEIKSQNQKTYVELNNWSKGNSTELLSFHPFYINNLTKKHAGVGAARKIAMDEAIRRFSMINNENGFIISLDADTTISKHYLSEIENVILKNYRINTILPWFEHETFTDNQELNKAITEYELHLRYFKLALKYTGFPYAYHSIGSAFAVKALAYVKQGGMNRKQGGEDFYFLQKVFKLGKTFELNKAKVFPSNRASDRVPFGTGPAVKRIINDGHFLSYKPEYFNYIKQVFDSIDLLYSSNDLKHLFNQYNSSIQEFITYPEFHKHILEIRNNSANADNFKQRFFNWFDCFKIIKYLNYFHERDIKIPVQKATTLFLKKTIQIDNSTLSINELLLVLRALETTS